MENSAAHSASALDGLVLGMQPHMPPDGQMTAAMELLADAILGDAAVAAVAIPSLIVMLRQPEVYTNGAGPALTAATVLCVMAYSNPELRAAAVAAGAIPALVSLMQGAETHPDVQKSAAIALVKLASDSARDQSAIVDAGGIPTMARLLHWKDGSLTWDMTQ